MTQDERELWVRVYAAAMVGFVQTNRSELVCSSEAKDLADRAVKNLRSSQKTL